MGPKRVFASASCWQPQGLAFRKLGHQAAAGGASAGLASRCDLRRTFLDHLRIFNPGGQEKGILTSDGVHLNSAGNTLVASEAARALRQAAAGR